MLKQQKIMIVDGYNVLRNNTKYSEYVGQNPDFKDWTTEVWNSAREALLKDVLEYDGNFTHKIIVYDAANRIPSDENAQDKKTLVANTEIIFTDPGESADTRIQKISKACREKNYKVTVVSSDKQIQNATMNNNVARMSARDFALSVEDEKQETPILNSNKTSRSTIENIVDTQTAKKLRDLRDSL